MSEDEIHEVFAQTCDEWRAAQLSHTPSNCSTLREPTSSARLGTIMQPSIREARWRYGSMDIVTRPRRTQRNSSQMIPEPKGSR